MEIFLGFYSSLIQADNFVSSHCSSSIVSSSLFLHSKAKEYSVFQQEKTCSVRLCQSLQIACMCFAKKLKHRSQTCVSPHLPADSSCQQTKANHFSLSLEELKPFILLFPLLPAKDFTKQNLLLQKANNHIKTDFVFCYFWDWPMHCNCDTWKATSGGLHWVISLLSLCKYMFGCTSAATLAKCWCRNSEAMLRMLSLGRQTQLLGWREESCWLHVDAGLELQGLC